MASSPRTFSRISAALMFSTSLTFAGMALSARANAQSVEEAQSAFEASGYTYCDARLIALLENEPVERAKIQIGTTIIAGRAELITSALATARQNHSCSWSDTGHSYEDAEMLAAAWALPSASEAKDKAADLYTQGRSAEVLAAIQSAGGGEMSAEDQAAWNAFQDSDYTYCDAKLLGAAWSLSIDRAKAEIGHKVLGGDTAQLLPALAQGRQTTSCGFWDTGLTYEDAEKLAGVWGVDVTRAKDMAAEYYTNGRSAVVLGALGPSAPSSPPPVVK